MRLSVKVALANASCAFMLASFSRVTENCEHPSRHALEALPIALQLCWWVDLMMTIVYCITREESDADTAIDFAWNTSLAATPFLFFLVPICFTIDAAAVVWAMRFVFELTVTVAAAGLVCRCVNGD